MSLNLKFWCYVIDVYFVNKFRVIPKIRHANKLNTYKYNKELLLL